MDGLWEVDALVNSTRRHRRSSSISSITTGHTSFAEEGTSFFGRHDGREPTATTMMNASQWTCGGATPTRDQRTEHQEDHGHGEDGKSRGGGGTSQQSCWSVSASVAAGHLTSPVFRSTEKQSSTTTTTSTTSFVLRAPPSPATYLLRKHRPQPNHQLQPHPSSVQHHEPHPQQRQPSRRSTSFSTCSLAAPPPFSLAPSAAAAASLLPSNDLSKKTPPPSQVLCGSHRSQRLVRIELPPFSVHNHDHHHLPQPPPSLPSCSMSSSLHHPQSTSTTQNLFHDHHHQQYHLASEASSPSTTTTTTTTTTVDAEMVTLRTPHRPPHPLSASTTSSGMRRIMFDSTVTSSPPSWSRVFSSSGSSATTAATLDASSPLQPHPPHSPHPPPPPQQEALRSPIRTPNSPPQHSHVAVLPERASAFLHPPRCADPPPPPPPTAAAATQQQEPLSATFPPTLSLLRPLDTAMSDDDSPRMKARPALRSLHEDEAAAAAVQSSRQSIREVLERMCKPFQR